MDEHTSSPIGTPVPRVEGKQKVTGRAKYTADYTLPDMLWGAVLHSTIPHGRIVRIDTTKARALPGVHTVLTGQDIGDVRYGRSVADIPVLAYDRVRYAGEPIAAVAAEDRDVAKEAVALIEVAYEELPAVFDPFEAMQPGAPLLHPQLEGYRRGGLKQGPAARDADFNLMEARARNVVSYEVESKGDVEQGFREADLVFEHTFRTSIIHQSYMEPHTCLVSAEPDGKTRIWASNKALFAIRDYLAMDLDLPDKDIILEPTWVGGDYGGKGSPLGIPIAYFLSKASGRPVKLIWDLAAEFIAANPRHRTWITIRSGLKRDGRIVARHVKMVADSGAYAGYKPIGGAVIVGSRTALGVYKTAHARFECTIVYTNHVSAGHMRSPGAYQSAWACEADIDRLAAAMGMDPIEFRLLNGVEEGDEGPLGEPWSSVHLKECLEAVRAASGWDQPKPPNVGRGVALAQDRTGSGASTALVEVDAGGGVTLRNTVIEQGAGMLTILAQIVAHELQLPMESISVEQASTEAELYDRGSGALSVTHAAGQAALGAVVEAREKLTAVACDMLDCQPEEVQLSAGVFQAPDSVASVSFADVAARACAGGEPVTGYCRYEGWQREYGAAFSAQVAEVEVDPRTGQVKVRRIVNAAEIGALLNPIGATGQMEGATVVALGHTTMEELRLADGRVQNTSLREYKLPTTGDLPAIENILIHGEGGGPGPYGSKTVADLALIVGPAAITNAICDAVGVRFDDLPITAEKVYQALKARRARVEA